MSDKGKSEFKCVESLESFPAPEGYEDAALGHRSRSPLGIWDDLDYIRSRRVVFPDQTTDPGDARDALLQRYGDAGWEEEQVLATYPWLREPWEWKRIAHFSVCLTTGTAILAEYHDADLSIPHGNIINVIGYNRVWFSEYRHYPNNPVQPIGGVGCFFNIPTQGYYVLSARLAQEPNPTGFTNVQGWIDRKGFWAGGFSVVGQAAICPEIAYLSADSHYFLILQSSGGFFFLGADVFAPP
jgi:hypothetical protein